jgi:hypothetical protein
MKRNDLDLAHVRAVLRMKNVRDKYMRDFMGVQYANTTGRGTTENDLEDGNEEEYAADNEGVGQG